MREAYRLVYPICVFRGNKPFPVELHHVNIAGLFDAGICLLRAVRAVVLDGDVSDVMNSRYRIVNDYDPIGIPDPHIVHPETVCQHETVVCVEL